MNAFLKTSHFLRQRAFFKNITILVPHTWREIEIDGSAIDETHDKSDILIDHPESGQDHTPFTVKTTPCGQFGYYTRLTPDYLQDENIAAKYGPYDKVRNFYETVILKYSLYLVFSTLLRSLRPVV